MKTAGIIAASALLLSSVANSAEIKVLSTQATQQAYLELVAQFEKATGHKVATIFTGTLNVQKRLADGEAYDLIIMAGPAIDEQIGLGKAAAGSRVDFAKSGTGVAVRKGAAKPDIGSAGALKKTLLAAKSIGYSTGPSGVYMLGVFEKLGIAGEIKGKLKQTPSGVFVGTLIASGETEIGFQQISELVHFPGIDYVGPLPGELQRMTVFSAGIHAGAKQAEAARALLKFITAAARPPSLRAVVRHLPPAAVARCQNLWADAEQGRDCRQRRGHARVHRQRQRPHACVQILPQTGGDRCNHRLRENGAGARCARTGRPETRRSPMNTIRTMLLACATSLLAANAAHAADQLLSGAITSRSGQKLEGVTVSAKLEGSTITTSVYTDTAGNYFFPPLPAGKYRVWAQALGFETGKGAVELSATRRADFTLQEMSDPERRFRQLPGEMMVAALPEASADDARAKKIFMNNCTGCHSTSYALQFRFDEAGWSKIIDLMKVVPVTGVYPGPNAKSNQIMERHQKQLAAYLARARGPGESSMKV